MRRLLVGGALCLVCGVLFVIRGIVHGAGADIGLGAFGVLLGAGSLLSYKWESGGQP
jgi:hypothetical protein